MQDNISILYANVGIDYFPTNYNTTDINIKKCDSDIQNIAAQLDEKKQKLNHTCGYPKTLQYTCSFIDKLQNKADIYLFGEVCNYDYEKIQFSHKYGQYYNMAEKTRITIYEDNYPYICQPNINKCINDINNILNNMQQIKTTSTISKNVISYISTTKNSFKININNLCKLVSIIRIKQSNGSFYDPNKLQLRTDIITNVFHTHFYRKIFNSDIDIINNCNGNGITENNIHKMIIEHQTLLLTILLEGIKKIEKLITFNNENNENNENNVFDMALDRVFHLLYENNISEIVRYVNNNFYAYINNNGNVINNEWVDLLTQTIKLEMTKTNNQYTQYILITLLHYIKFDEEYLINFYPHLTNENRNNYFSNHISFIMKIPDDYIKTVMNSIKTNIISGKQLVDLNKKLFLTGSNKYNIKNIQLFNTNNEIINYEPSDDIIQETTDITNNFHITVIPNINMYIINVHMRGKNIEETYKTIIKFSNSIRQNTQNNIIIVGDFNNDIHGFERKLRLQQHTLFNHKINELNINEFFLGSHYAQIFSKCGQEWLRQMNLHLYYYLPNYNIDNVSLVKINNEICSLITPISSHFPFIINLKPKEIITIDEYKNNINQLETLLLHTKDKLESKIREKSESDNKIEALNKRVKSFEDMQRRYKEKGQKIIILQQSIDDITKSNNNKIETIKLKDQEISKLKQNINVITASNEQLKNDKNRLSLLNSLFMDKIHGLENQMKK